MLDIITNFRLSGFQQYIFIRGANGDSVQLHMNSSANLLMQIVEKKFVNIVVEVNQYFYVDTENYSDCSRADNVTNLCEEMTVWLSKMEC